MSRIEEIEAFVAIARAGSISRAAISRNQTKSALSRRLAELEQRLGAQLITRTTRQMSLTDSGAAFLQRSEHILDDLAEAEAAVSGSDFAFQGRLKIAAPLSFGVSRLKPVVSQFIKAHPDLQISIDFSDRNVDLVAEGVDVALRIGKLGDSSLIARKVAPVGHAVAASPAFWDQHGRPDSPADLAHLPCLQYANLARPTVLSFTSPTGETGEISPPIKLLASNGDFLASLATDGCGFLTEPKFILQDFLLNGQLECVLDDYTWSDTSLYLVYPPSRLIATKTRAFSEAVIKALGR